ncbi:MAG: DUF2268 domain-containing putative Zn-dependent protease [Weeksellaceae bacterium]
MNLHLHILSASGTLAPFIDSITENYNSALKVITDKIPVRNVDIVVYDNPEGTLEEDGLGGYTPNANQVFISVNPAFDKLNESIDKHLKRILAHELHHTLRWQNPGYGKTLFEALITEGLADHFDLELFNEEPEPWSNSFNKVELDKLMEKAMKELNNNTYNHFAWFYGDEDLNIPKWAGYSLGFKLVKDYLETHPEEKPSQLYSINANEFLKEV